MFIRAYEYRPREQKRKSRNTPSYMCKCIKQQNKKIMSNQWEKTEFYVSVAGITGYPNGKKTWNHPSHSAPGQISKG